jgi:hypothetical protein
MVVASVIVATPNHVFARFPAHENHMWNTVKAQRQAMWASFREEAQGLRASLRDTKARGDWQAVKEVCTISTLSPSLPCFFLRKLTIL